ncbi:MAG: hypothetical protein IPI65_16345 [Bacteroidetes bacterium]|nr:hypothetical protein [Bacteroidota bacterium]
MVFKYLGEIKNGERIAKDWGDATESYFLEEKDGITTLNVQLNMGAEAGMEDYFNGAFQRLEVVKQLRRLICFNVYHCFTII